MPGCAASSAASTSASVAALDGDLGGAAGVGAQDRGDPDGDAHAGLPLGPSLRPIAARNAVERRGGWSARRARRCRSRQRVERLEPVAGVEHDGLGVRVERARREQLAQDGRRSRRRRSRRRCPRSRASSRMPSTISSSVTSSIAPPVRRTTSSAYGPSAGLPMASDLAIVSGFTGRTTSWPAANAVRRPASSRSPARRTPCTASASTRPSATSSRERLVDLGQQRAGRDRDDDLLRQPPAELLGDLVAERLGALGVVRPQVDVDERPSRSRSPASSRAEPVDVVVGALDRDQRAAVDRGRDDLAGLEVGRDEDAPSAARPGPPRRRPRWPGCRWRRRRRW